MANTVPARSILKQPSNKPTPTLSDEQEAKIERDRRHLGIALYHANKIQSQKDCQTLILSNIEKLLEFPSGVPAESSEFGSLVAPFQPSDLDSLVEERRIDGKCGYALCSNTPRSASLGASAAWKLSGQGAGDYCSNECLRKSLYVKTQLSEVPAWERERGQQPQIVLLGDDITRQDRASSNVRSREQLNEMNTRELALERGEQTSSFRPNQVMTDTIVEKPSRSHPLPALKQSNGSSYASIEGYVPTLTPQRASTPSVSGDANEKPDTDVDHAELDNPADEEDLSWQLLYENVSKR